MKSLFALLLLLWLPCFAEEHLLVSIAPYQEIVERIAGETAVVHVMVPSGASAHTFEPSARQVIEASKSSLWFQIGEGFEGRALRALQSHHPDLKAVDLQQGLDLIQQGCCPKHTSFDVHTWLSPRMLKQQAVTIAQALQQRYPDKSETYAKNLETLLADLTTLDEAIQSKIAPMQHRTIVVSHPAYAYFCRDYNLKQLPIEQEGRDPSPRQLTTLLDTIRQLQTHTIYAQDQHSTKAAYLIAQQIDGQVILLDPYASDYFGNMRTIAENFAKQG